MKILSFVFFALQTVWEANCLKCHVNEKGAEPKETECKAEETYCMFEKHADGTKRQCSPEVANAKHGCVKMEAMKSTTCFCQTDNCNNMCKAEGCKKMPIPMSRRFDNTSSVSQMPIPSVDPSLLNVEVCKANCQTAGGGDDKPNGDATKKPEETGETKAEGKPDGESTKDPKEAEGTKAGACLGCNQSFGNLLAILIASAMLASICNS